MHTVHTTFSLGQHRLHQITFTPDTFSKHDLLWLPHHTLLANAGRKRQTEHLAGRIAAVHALLEYNQNTVPAPGDQRQPLWPTGLYGSISHCDTTALAVVSTRPVGIDIETLFTAQLSDELADSIIDPQERTLLLTAPLSFPHALTLAFSAKESLFKAWSALAAPAPGFHSARIVSLTTNTLVLQPCPAFSAHLSGTFVTFHWARLAQNVVTVTA